MYQKTIKTNSNGIDEKQDGPDRTKRTRNFRENAASQENLEDLVLIVLAQVQILSAAPMVLLRIMVALLGIIQK